MSRRDNDGDEKVNSLRRTFLKGAALTGAMVASRSVCGAPLRFFKPMLVDRTIFSLLNKKALQGKHFDSALNGCFLNNTGKQIYLKAMEERLSETIQHRALGKKVSYKYLIRLECYKITKYLLGMEPVYKPFKIWW